MYKSNQLFIGTLEVLWLEHTQIFSLLQSKYNVTVYYIENRVYLKGINYLAAQQEIENRLFQYQVELYSEIDIPSQIYIDLQSKYDGLWIVNKRDLIFNLQKLRDRQNYTAQLPNMPTNQLIMWLPKYQKEYIIYMLSTKRINLTAKETLTFLLVLDFARIEQEFGVQLKIEQKSNQYFMTLRGNNYSKPLKIINETLFTRTLFQYFHPAIELSSADLDYCEQKLSQFRVSLFSYEEVEAKQLFFNEFQQDYNSIFVFAPITEQNFIIDQLTLLIRQIDQQKNQQLLLIQVDQLLNFIRKIYKDKELYQISYFNDKQNFDFQNIKQQFYEHIKELSYVFIDFHSDLIYIITKEQYQKFCTICDEFFIGAQYFILNNKSLQFLDQLKNEYNIQYKKTSNVGILTEQQYESIQSDEDGQNYACKIWNFLYHDKKIKQMIHEGIELIQINQIVEQIQQEIGLIKVLSQNQIEYLRSQQIELIKMGLFGKYIDQRYDYVKLETQLNKEFYVQLEQIAMNDVEQYIKNTQSKIQINDYCWKICIQQNALLFYKRLSREFMKLNYENVDNLQSDFKLKEIFIDIDTYTINSIEDVIQVLKDSRCMILEKPPSRNYLTALFNGERVPQNATQLDFETSLIRGYLIY